MRHHAIGTESVEACLMDEKLHLLDLARVKNRRGNQNGGDNDQTSQKC